MLNKLIIEFPYGHRNELFILLDNIVGTNHWRELKSDFNNASQLGRTTFLINTYIKVSVLRDIIEKSDVFNLIPTR